jgi:ribonuclease D
MTAANDRDVVFVDRPELLRRAVAAIRESEVVGFDTEFVGESTYEPVFCLAQVAADDRIYVIDPLAGLDLGDFWQALTEPGREVIALAARQEVLFCLRYAGRAPERVFDPQVAAGLVGYGYPLSHTSMVQRVLDVRIKGGETYTDWRKRPLTVSQRQYAAEDVRYLVAVRQSLMTRARELDRELWVDLECAALVRRIAQGQDEERWQRTAGAGRLDRRELAVLRAVWVWRDQTARARNLPPRRVLPDELMMQAVRRKPQTAGDLLQLRGTDRLKRDADMIVAAVAQGLHAPASDLPEALGRDDPPQVQVLGQLASIVANSLAAEHQVDIALLATTADLQAVVRWHLGVSKERPEVLDGWRGEILGRPLLDLLEGRSTVRVGDTRSRSPLRIEPRETGRGSGR